MLLMTQNEISFHSDNDIVSTSNAYFVKHSFDAMLSAKTDRMEASPHIKQLG